MVIQAFAERRHIILIRGHVVEKVAQELAIRFAKQGGPRRRFGGIEDWLLGAVDGIYKGWGQSWKTTYDIYGGAILHPKGIWKGSESGCDEPILLGGCRTASMDAPWENGRDGAAEASP